MSTTSSLIDGFRVSVTGHFASLVPYPPDNSLEEVEREYGVTKSLRPASNKHPLGPSLMAVTAIHEALSRSHHFRDGSGCYVRKRLSNKNYRRLNAGFLRKMRDPSEPWGAHSMNCGDQTE